MKTTPITPDDLSSSVVAVPPFARHEDLSVNRAANLGQLRHLEAGGVRSVLYGGNANFYHIPLGEFQAVLDMLAEDAGEHTWILPSVGPDYGKAIDQAVILRDSPYPTAMMLPMTFPFTSEGLAAGFRRFTDAMGKPGVMYIKADDYIQPDALAALVEEGRVSAVKYAVVRKGEARDNYLDALLQGVDRRLIVSGIGERPAITHVSEYGLAGFTSGSVCIAPKGSMALLALLREGRIEEAEAVRARYMPMEDCRDEISPIRVLHDAVTLAGVADMGPMLPMLSGLSEAERAIVAPVAKALLQADAV